MNLLTDPVFRVETPDGQERLSLPQLLEALGLDRVESLPGLQRHQEDAFHIFLCYLAGAVLARESQTDPRQSSGFWLEGIRHLTEAHIPPVPKLPLGNVEPKISARSQAPAWERGTEDSGLADEHKAELAIGGSQAGAWEPAKKLPLGIVEPANYDSARSQAPAWERGTEDSGLADEHKAELAIGGSQAGAWEPAKSGTLEPPNYDCAWTLVVDDVTQPAFMQAPVPKKADFSAFHPTKPKAKSADQMDLLVISRNHDVKFTRISNKDVESWVYALVSLQTMTCYLGVGQYGIARSSGGTGCRPRVGLEFSLRIGVQWTREVRILLGYRHKILFGPWKYSDTGIVLTWVPFWNLSTSISIESLDPFFIEISRAIRLVRYENKIYALSANSGPMVLAKSIRESLNGRLGDPWIPINITKESALNVLAEGFTPKRLRELIFLKNGEESIYEPSFMQESYSEDSGSCYFYASALARRGKNSNTEGFHVGHVYIPSKTRPRLFRSGPERDRLARLSEDAIFDAGQMQNRVLKVALFSFLEGGQNIDKIDWEKREVKEWWKTTEKQFSEEWSSNYFPWLWTMAEQEDADAARLEWLKALRDKAKTVLDDAIARYPARSGRRYRSRVKAEGMFAGCLYKKFPELKETRHESNRPD